MRATQGDMATQGGKKWEKARLMRVTQLTHGRQNQAESVQNEVELAPKLRILQ
jgi:hypothetical protein